MKIRNMYVALDCDDPMKLAQFYSKLTNFKLIDADDTNNNLEWIELNNENDEVEIAFQKIPNYRKPTWPEGTTPQQAHLDFIVNDLSEAEKLVVGLGATKAPFQPGSPASSQYEYEFIVFFDPAGHPFCLISDKK
jgi:hypothetical protein